MKAWARILIVVVLGFLVYGNTLLNQFVWDDTDAVRENYFIRSWSNLPAIVTHEYFQLSNELTYRPLVTLTYFIDHSLWGLAPWGYHLSNTVLHILVAIVLMLVLQAVSRDPRLSLMGALLFLAHPVNTEAVNVVGFREDPLAALFMLAGFGLYIRFSRRAGGGGWALYVAALACYFLGLLSKEMAATLPLVLAAYDWLFRAGPANAAWVRRHVVRYAGFLGVLALYLAIRFILLHNPKETAIEYLQGSVGLTMLATAGIIATYIKLMVLPVGLCAHYPVAAPRFPLDTEVVLSAALIALCLGYAWRIRRARPLEAFAILSFFLFLLPVANVIPIVNKAAERYLYIPALAYCIWLAALLRRRQAPVWILVAILAVYSGITIRRNMDWRDSQTIWSETGKRYPDSADIHHELGDWHAGRGETPQAIEEYRKALAINPNHQAVHVNLGVAYDALGQQDLALEQYQMALKINPTVSKVHNNVGNIYYKKGMYDRAVQSYGQAIRLNPNYPQPYNNLAMAYLQLGQATNAETTLQRALSMAPEDVGLVMNLVLVYLNEDRETDARKLTDRLAAQGADVSSAHSMFGDYLARKGRTDDAIREYRGILKSKANDPGVFLRLGELYESTGAAADAAQCYERFLTLWRGGADVRDRVREALARMKGDGAGATRPPDAGP